MKIPKEFQLFGETITVEFSDNLEAMEAAYGIYYRTCNKIILQKSVIGSSTSEDKLYLNFLHELTHCILDKSEYRDLKNDEQLVEIISKLLHQAFKTARY